MFEALLLLITENNIVIKKNIYNFKSYQHCEQYLNHNKTYDDDNAYLTLQKEKYKVYVEYCYKK